MCQYRFLHFETCGHRVIALASYCRQKLWIAATGSAFELCHPEPLFLLTPTSTETNGSDTVLVPWPFPEKVAWDSIKKSCQKCACRLQLSLPSLNEPVACQRHLPDDFLSRVQIDPMLNNDGPTIYVPFFELSIKDMLGISDQMSENVPNHRMMLPEKFDQGIWTQVFKSLPWVSQGKWVPAPGTNVTSLSMMEPAIQFGLTARDRAAVALRIMNGRFDWFEYWTTHFKDRGMSALMMQRFMKDLLDKVTKAQPVKAGKSECE